jgi:DNA primase
MPLIPEGVIDEIQTRSDIAELIGRYVPLKRSGRHFKANCPFHKERTPSFMVNTDKQIYHCFGCGSGGNIFSFLMQHDRLTFPEAVRQLADHVGVQLPERESEPSDSSHEQLLALMEKVCSYFERTLLAPQQGYTARAYLQKRGVPDSTRLSFRLGFAPCGWDHVLKAASTTGVSSKQLEAAGLVIQGTSGHYDRFRNRLIFPIMDVRGRVMGFGGRSLDSQEPKYLNSPETTVYSKGRCLFGLSQAKDAIIAAKTAILVEGYFDCVILAGAGVKHVVSPLGTALTVDHARLLKRYAEHIILAFDPDAAGEIATLRGIDLLVEVGLNVRVAQLPPGVDPDECLRAYGRERFEQLLSRGKTIFDFLVESATRRYPVQETEGKVRAAQFILPTIAKMPDAMLRSEYVRLLADRLKLDEGAVAQELVKATPRAMGGNGSLRETSQAMRSVAAGPERLLSALILDDPKRWARVQDQVSLDDVTDPTLRHILSVICELEAAGHATSPAQVVSRFSGEGQGVIVTSLVEFARSIEAKDEALDDCVRRLRASTRKRHLANLREQIRAAQDAGADAEVGRLLAEYQTQVQAKGG